MWEMKLQLKPHANLCMKAEELMEMEHHKHTEIYMMEIKQHHTSLHSALLSSLDQERSGFSCFTASATSLHLNEAGVRRVFIIPLISLSLGLFLLQDFMSWFLPGFIS